MKNSLRLWLLFLTTAICFQLPGQDLQWIPIPAAAVSGVALDSDHKKVMGELPQSIRWKDGESGEWFVSISGIGEPDPYGVSTVVRIKATSPSGTKSEIITPSTDHWLPVYGFFSPGDPHSGKTSVNKTSIGDWDIWEASIEPITNGDPPGYRL